MDYVLMAILGVFAIAILLICRQVIVWWTGINEVIKEQQRTNSLLAELLKK